MAIQAQERRRTHHHEEAPDDVESAQPSGPASTADLKNDLDDILDEIDEILEENAEEFVKGYVQKGREYARAYSAGSQARPVRPSRASRRKLRPSPSAGLRLRKRSAKRLEGPVVGGPIHAGGRPSRPSLRGPAG